MELEDHAEHVHETIHEHVSKGGHDTPPSAWHTYVALSTLFMALFSAFAALMAALSAHESLLERTQEILDFVELETDRLEIEVLRSKHAILGELETAPAAQELARIEAYLEDEELMQERTAEEEAITQSATGAHLVFAFAVTLLSVGITLSGIAIIAHRRFPWFIGLVFGLAGAIAVIIGLRDMPGL